MPRPQQSKIKLLPLLPPRNTLLRGSCSSLAAPLLFDPTFKPILGKIHPFIFNQQEGKLRQQGCDLTAGTGDLGAVFCKCAILPLLFLHQPFHQLPSHWETSVPSLLLPPHSPSAVIPIPPLPRLAPLSPSSTASFYCKQNSYPSVTLFLACSQRAAQP